MGLGSLAAGLDAAIETGCLHRRANSEDRTEDAAIFAGLVAAPHHGYAVGHIEDAAGSFSGLGVHAPCPRVSFEGVGVEVAEVREGS